MSAVFKIHPLGLSVLVAVLQVLCPGMAHAQAEFRRGDANGDEIVDIGDVDFINAVRFRGEMAPTCLAATDTNGDGDVSGAIDSLFLASFLYDGDWPPPSPGPAMPGPPSEFDESCASYPALAPPAVAEVAFGFECPDGIAAHPGEIVRVEVFATLTTTPTNTSVGRGASAWSLGIAAENLRIVSVTTAGTAAALTVDDPPGFRELFSFFFGGVLDPALETDAGPQGEGAVSAAVLGLSADAALPAEGTVRLLALTIEVQVPVAGTASAVLRFEDGKIGRGQPVRNVVSFDGNAHRPVLGVLELVLNDCNQNGVADDLDVAAGTSADCDGNGIPDECDPDCNANGLPDGCDIASGASTDCGGSGIPDECEYPEIAPGDCDGNGRPDSCDIADGMSADCNRNGLPDSCDIAGGTSADCSGDGVPDECDPDCNGNGYADSCDIASRSSSDVDSNGVPDECESCLPAERPDCPPEEPPVRFGFRGSCAQFGAAGEVRDVTIDGQIDLRCLGARTIAQWQLAIVAEGCEIVAATAQGTDADHHDAFTGVVDPLLNDGRNGAVTWGALFFLPFLPPSEEPYSVMRLTVRMALPAEGECAECVLRHAEGGLAYQQHTVRNWVYDAADPALIGIALDPMAIQLCSGADCDGDGVPDERQLREGRSTDANENGIPDECEPARFLRGDCDSDGFAGGSVTDPVFYLNWAFGGASVPGCLAACDADGDGFAGGSVTDAVYYLNWAFGGGPSPPAPFPGCGPAGEGDLDCLLPPVACMGGP